MIIAMKITEMFFSSTNKHDAYLKGCKNTAKYVRKAKRDCNEHLIVQIEDQMTEIPTFKFTFYNFFDFVKANKSYCTRCQALHKAFFINESFNCNCCSLKTFAIETNNKLKIGNNFYKSKLQQE